MTKSIDRLTARILVAQPTADAQTIQRLVWQTRSMRVDALTQKVKFLRPGAGDRALAR